MAKKDKRQEATAAGTGTTTTGTSPDSAAFARLEQRLEATANNFKEKTDNSEARIKNLGDDFKRELNEREVRVMEVLSVFVVVLTFVSTNISIFSRIDSLFTAVLFMIGMSMCVVFILAALFAIIHHYKFEETPLSKLGIIIPALAAVALLLALAFMPSLNKPLNPPSDSVQQQLNFQQLEIKTLQDK